jgi:hypothetical protein
MEETPMSNTNHSEYANGLRAVADFIESHPEIKVPISDPSFSVFPSVGKDEVRDHAAKVVHALGRVEKEEFGDSIQLCALIGGFKYQVWYPRDQICEKVELGRKIIPATPRIVETVVKEAVEEHEEIVYGWKCQPILGETPAKKISERLTMTSTPERVAP